MKKTAFVFPGQGAQIPGMGKDLYENFTEVRSAMDAMAKQVPFDLLNLCFEGPKERLDQTSFTQPCLYAVSTAIYQLVHARGCRADYHAGLSLGEYSALSCAGMLSYEEGVRLVHNRGLFMEQAVEKGKGAMAAIIGLDTASIEEALDQARANGIVEIANYNYAKQTVIGGETDAVQKAMELCKELGCKRALPLPVSGPFHTSMLEPASKQLAEYLEQISLHPEKLPVISNVTAKPYVSLDESRELLARQVTSPVQWQKTVEYLVAQGVDTFVELGPGKTLSNFIKRIDRKVKTLHVEDSHTFALFLKEREEQTS
ncbi:MAG TPA: [acyl-carrier-protein] S-malonyltransferase [Eubacteriaceae bacterium]|nr:[acyl-carrier-protein] S-malonyltransferase [Eubacteriaceae bacterium]